MRKPVGYSAICKRYIIILGCLVFGVYGGNVIAEPRALLIGIGEYETPRYNLDGIDLDIQIMVDVAGKLGFTRDQIMVLENEQATRKNIEAAFQNHFRGVTADDQVLIYFSGHGSQLPDDNNEEADKFDETLTLYELGRTGEKDGGMLRDDDLNKLLQRIPSANKVLLVDACCSGTAAKSATFGGKTGLRLQPKSSNCPSARAGSGAADSFVDSHRGAGAAGTLDGLVYLSAAQDTQEALASPEGSIFTLGIRKAVNENLKITPKDLLTKTTDYIASNVRPSSMFEPNLTGDTVLFGKPIYITTQVSQPVERDRWSNIVAGADIRMEMFSPRKSYVNGERIKIDIEMPFEGYLNVISIDSSDNATVMYPNQFSAKTVRRSAGLVSMPDSPFFGWAAMEPFGPTRFIAIATAEPLNLYTDSIDYDNGGKPFAPFLKPAPSSTRGLGRANSKPSAQPRFAAGEVVFNTCVSGC